MKIEDGFIAADELTKKTGSQIIKNTGKIIAAITLFVAIMLTFTEISFASFTAEKFTGNLVIILICSYLMYFSLEDAGEKLAIESKEYEDTRREYDNLVKQIGGEETPFLRKFLIEYSEKELDFRRRNYLFSNGMSNEEYEQYKAGACFSRREKAIFKRAQKMHAIYVTPRVMLTCDERKSKSELHNPSRYKRAGQTLKLLPSLVCACVTVSIMLTVKDGMTVQSVIESIVKLSTLPIIGIRGYSSGYSYVKRRELPWLITKQKILDAFIKSRGEKTQDT